MAAFRARLDVSEMEDLQRRLTRLPGRVEKVGRSALTEWGRGAGVRMARSFTPRRSGRLARSWRYRDLGRGGVLEARERYAGPVLWGGRRYGGHSDETRRGYSRLARSARAVVAAAVEEETRDALGA